MRLSTLSRIALLLLVVTIATTAFGEVCQWNDTGFKRRCPHSVGEEYSFEVACYTDEAGETHYIMCSNVLCNYEYESQWVCCYEHTNCPGNAMCSTEHENSDTSHHCSRDGVMN